MIRIDAVSYTHLDVYKRQDHDRGSRTHTRHHRHDDGGDARDHALPREPVSLPLLSSDPLPWYLASR